MAGTKADAKAETSGGGGGSFSEKGLAEKLNKLNSSAASIQSILVSVDLFLDRLQT
jgi:regulator of Ty1 transposition protein 103